MYFYVVQEAKQFDNWVSFLTWKEEEEESAFCHFVQPTGERINDIGIQNYLSIAIDVHVHYYTPFPVDQHRTVVYTCCRDGKYRGNTDHRMSSQKRITKESRKLGSDLFCLANMTVIQNIETGKVTVTYTATHTNHHLSLMECKHLPIPKSVKEKVKTMLANGVQMEKIMDGMYL